MSVGEKVKGARKLKGMSRAELGQLIGKSEHTIKKYEIDKVVPAVDVLKQIAQILDVDLSDLLGAKPMPKEIATKSRYYFAEQYLYRLGYSMRWDTDGNIILFTPNEEVEIDEELQRELYESLDSYANFKIQEIINKSLSKGMRIHKREDTRR